jgi:hypothetical protein
MKISISCAILALAFAACTLNVTSGQDSKPAAPGAPKPSTPNDAEAGKEYSGMYSFLKEGEFVQITVEDEARVTGFVSRYGEGDSGAFLDQYFRSGKLNGNKLAFVTESVHGVWFEFNGTVERGSGKNPGDEGYFVLKGKLTQHSSDAEKKDIIHSQEVALTIFPDEKPPAPPARN